ncbi:glycerol-3-phosphate dehydrogenase [Sphingobium vermicomposti]|uniref:Glycerol-3-phosphate dehydrogenase n=1 Tax=Sphingobium vermicomposti TaxID=529005 RepID=A0A846M738_9SPHN|nr:glycerol-3-phosphate dehydrogenase [Sphingobium vermicomposti]
MDDCDLLIVGGGINGAGIARDAAGRGLKVMLVEQHDLASHTSSASTKLIHGGLRYLEYGEFRLVREALAERERLWAMAPHIIWPLRFVIPQTQSLRPAWLLRIGLFLYDHIGGRKRLPATQTIALGRSPLGAALANRKGRGFVYSDCWVEDSRLVVLNALDAAERGAQLCTHTRFLTARREDGVWIATISDAGGVRDVRARALVNAAGPWVADVIGRAAGARSERRVRLVKGSHIVVPRLYEGDHAYFLQNPDRRIMFAIPYEGRFTLLGTTEEPWEGEAGAASISERETDYLLDGANRYFRRQLGKADLVWSYAGIRPLYDDNEGNASAVTRDYVLDVDTEDGSAQILSVFGGKITTYRRLAEQAMTRLAPFFPQAGAAWTAGAALPGGDMPDADFARFVEGLYGGYPGLPRALLFRLARAYGTRAKRLLGQAQSVEDLGEDMGGGLRVAELDYLLSVEWARSAEDVLFRRSKLGLHVPQETAARVDAYIAANR